MWTTSAHTDRLHLATVNGIDLEVMPDGNHWMFQAIHTQEDPYLEQVVGFGTDYPAPAAAKRAAEAAAHNAAKSMT